MRVICIDIRVRPGNIVANLLEENKVYSVRKYWSASINNEGNLTNVPVYTLWEFGEMDGFEVDRFIPLSSIDETEFERNYNKELV